MLTIQASKIATSFFIIVASATLFGPSAQAMPMFARKYKVDCNMCHAAVPRLNFTGFKYKAAGYRMPWEIGKDQDEAVLKLENYTSFVAVLSAQLQMQQDNAAQTTTTTVTTTANELDVHPITGSFGANFGSGFELDAFTDGTVQISQAFLTFTAGSADSFGTIQVGVVPNFLGYGVLDRSTAVSVPLVLTESANNPILDTGFNWANPRAAGLTASYWTGDTYLSASVRDRQTGTFADTSTNAGAVTVDPLGTTGHMGDLLFSATQFIDHVGAGSAVSFFYYKGLSQIPMTSGSTSLYGNSFNHFGLTVNKYFTDHVNAFAGGGWNQDQRYDVNLQTTNETFHSFGTFAGLEYFWSPELMAGLRFDQFRTDLSMPDTQIIGGAAYMDWHVMKWVILSAEYQYLANGMNTGFAGTVNGAVGSVDDHILTAQATLTF